MFSQRIIQAAVREIYRYFKLTIAITDPEGRLLAFEGSGVGWPEADAFTSFARSDRRICRSGRWILFKITEADEPVLIAAAEAGRCKKMHIDSIRCSFSIAKHMDAACFDRADFLKQLIDGVLLPEQVTKAASEMGIPLEMKRIVYAILLPSGTTMEGTGSVCRKMQARLGDTAYVIDRGKIVLIHEPSDDDSFFEDDLLDAVSRTDDHRVGIGRGREASDLNGLTVSCRAAWAAIETGRGFGVDSRIYRYDDLVYEAWVVMQTKPVCDRFFKSSFNVDFFENMDEETEKIASVFLKNSMNLTRTAEELFYHRNALSYKLKNIRAASGLDLRDFTEASAFKLGWTLSRYIKDYKPNDRG